MGDWMSTRHSTLTQSVANEPARGRKVQGDTQCKRSKLAVWRDSKSNIGSQVVLLNQPLPDGTGRVAR